MTTDREAPLTDERPAVDNFATGRSTAAAGLADPTCDESFRTHPNGGAIYSCQRDPGHSGFHRWIGEGYDGPGFSRLAAELEWENR